MRRGRQSNTDIWFRVQEAQNIAVYGDKCWERWNFSGVYGSCFSTIDSLRFEEIVSANGAFQEIQII